MNMLIPPPANDTAHDLMSRMALRQYVTLPKIDAKIEAIYEALSEGNKAAFIELGAEANALYVDWDFDSLGAAVFNVYFDLQSLARLVREEAICSCARLTSKNLEAEASMESTVSTAGLSLSLNASAWYQQPDFLAWLESAEGLMSWHTPGQPVGEFTDIVVFVDPSLNGEGVQDGMPDAYWKTVVDHCKAHFSPSQTTHHISVVIKNL